MHPKRKTAARESTSCLFLVGADPALLQCAGKLAFSPVLLYERAS
jgi:hypothetical protein